MSKTKKKKGADSKEVIEPERSVDKLKELAAAAQTGDEQAAFDLIGKVNEGCDLLEQLFEHDDPKVRSALEKASRRKITFPLKKWNNPYADRILTSEVMGEKLPIGEDLLKVPKGIKRDRLGKVIIQSIWTINSVRTYETEARIVIEEVPSMASWVSIAAALPKLSTKPEVLSDWSDVITDWIFGLNKSSQEAAEHIQLLHEGSPLFLAANPQRREKRQRDKIIKQMFKLLNESEDRDEALVLTDLEVLGNQYGEVSYDPENVIVGLRKKIYERLKAIAKA